MHRGAADDSNSNLFGLLSGRHIIYQECRPGIVAIPGLLNDRRLVILILDREFYYFMLL
jgi:hypothetical protein